MAKFTVIASIALKHLSFYVVALLVFLFITPSLSTAQVSTSSWDKTDLQSASELDYPPFAIVHSDGTAGGFSVDLLEEAAHAAGLTVTFKVGQWSQIKEELARGELDVLPIVSYSEERDKIYDFTAPYLTMNGVVFVRKGYHEIKTLSDLKGKEVLVMNGDTAHEYLMRKNLTDSIITTPSFEQAFRLLAAGKHDAVVVQQIVGFEIIKKLGLTNIVAVEQKQVSSLKPVTMQLEGFEQKFCFAVSKGNQHLLSLLNEGLAILYLNGTYNRLYGKWFAPILPKPEVPLSELIKQSLRLLIPILLLLTLVGLWYLKRLVAQKTHYLQEEIQQRELIEKELADANAKYIKGQRLGKVGNWEYEIVTQEIHASSEAKRIFGFTNDTSPLALEKVESFILEREQVHQALVDLIENNVPYNLEYNITTEDRGECKTVNSLGELQRDESGKPVKIQGVILDITERKKSENALRESEERFRRVVAISPIPIMIHDEDDQVLQLSIGWTELSGYSLEDIPTLPDWTENAYGERTGTQKAYIDDLFNIACSVKNGEWTVKAKDGSIKIWEFQTTPLGESSRGKRILLSMAADVTERKQVEEALRNSEKRFRELFENAPFPYQSLDDSGCILEVNKRWLAHLGYSRDEVVGKSFAEFLHPDWQNHFRENFPKFKSVGEVLGIEFQLRKKDGTHIWASFDGTISRDRNGAFLQTHCIFNDISEQKRLQDKVNQQQEALNQSRKLESVGRLAGGIAHDFNNMLSVIIGYTELALEKLEPTDHLYSDLKKIYQAGVRSADITRQLLAFARRQTVAPKVLDLNDNIGSMMKMLRHLIGENIHFAWMPGTGLWSVKIDPSQIDQILANLCVNARDAITDIGKVTIETKNITFDKDYCADHLEFIPGEYVMLAVSDDGCGIAPETMPQIFEPFFTTKNIDEGTGLGLATVYGIVKQNNGFINVYSEPEKGTTMRVYLPRYAEQATKAQNETAVEVPQSRGETILLVEDDASILQLGVRILENLGYTVLSTMRPKDAKKLTEEYHGQINLLITDVVMPEMNGRELSEQLHHLYPQLKTLFMSGYTANVIAHRGVLDEGIHFISKPFSPKEIALKIREVLD
ncbi:MAG: PAS domain S-box protein [Desulfobulbus sp.]|nr:PAS domain S-box protein [Desulfobulbus sp.]